MTLRHYGRALAAASGAVLLCATLSVPALATPTSDTGAAAPVAASATDEGSAPITVTVTRTDSHGDKVYEGDLITITVTYTNNTDSTLTVFPVDSNLSGILTIGAPNCRWHNLAAHTTKQCTTATHTVTADDVAAGTFTPMTTWAATRDRNGTDVIAGGITANADPVTVAQGERPPGPGSAGDPAGLRDRRQGLPHVPRPRRFQLPPHPRADHRHQRLDHRRVGRSPRPEPAPAVTPAHWVNTGSGWKWQLEDSSYATNQTITIGDATYRFNSAGMMVTGWDLQDGKWSYYNAYGARVSGWIKDGSWYYLDPATGVMATGWVQVDGTWYLLSASGAMLTGWQHAGSWYYLATSGAMLTGWQMIDGRWYYFSSSGAWI